MENAKFWKEFFQLYKELPALWLIRSTDYTDRTLKSNCYLKLIEKLKEIYPKADREMVVKKINNFRISYKKEYKRLKEKKAQGETYTPTLWYFDYLRFLDDQNPYACGGCEKYVNENENTQEEKEVIKDDTNSHKKLPTKRYEDFKDSEEKYHLLKRKKLAHHYNKQQLKKLSLMKQNQSEIDAAILAKSWAVQYKELQGNQKLIVRKLINDILFYGCLGTLNMDNIVDVQKILQKQSKNPPQESNVQPHSPLNSNSSFRYEEKEFISNGSIRLSPVEFNSCSPPMSPTMDSVSELQAVIIKYEKT